MGSSTTAGGQPAAILTVPGLGGSGEAHWQSHWERADASMQRVLLPGLDAPRCDAWIRALAAAVEQAAGGAVLAAHSLGCALVAHVAGTHREVVLGGALMVAPSDVDSAERTPAECRSFAPMPMARLPFPSIVVASRDDPYVSFARARDFAAAWGADFVDAGNCGHINAAAGFGPWPAGLRILRRLVQSSGSPQAGSGRRRESAVQEAS